MILRSRGSKTDLMPLEAVFDHWAAHATFVALLAAHTLLAYTHAPTPLHCVTGFCLGAQHTHTRVQPEMRAQHVRG
eukprot:SAG22_NODE_161_length_16908_cov_39.687965_18_plen_76_part_00